MITGELKSRIDKLWTEFWIGGITNPLTVIEQITFLMFARLLDITETRNENCARRTGRAFQRIFGEPQQALCWSRVKHLSAEVMLPRVRDQVFPHFKTVAVDGAKFGEYMKDAQLMIQKPSLLVSAINMIDDLPLTQGDTKGDLYEYLLSKLTTAGINGQFRTPRHIIRLMVELLDPQPTQTIADPACGTGGFLVGVVEYLLRTHTSAEGVIEHEDNGKIEKTYTGDLLEDHWAHIRGGMFHGYDFDATMLRIAAMNLLLHGVDAPDIHYQDTLSNSFTEHFPQGASDAYDLILANPPFKGSLDYEDVHPSLLKKVKTKKTELLFAALMLRMLKLGGRCAVVVPDGVLFGCSKAHQALCKLLVDDNQLESHRLALSKAGFDKEKQGTTHKTIYMPIVRQFKIFLSPIPIQKKFAKLAKWQVDLNKKNERLFEEKNKLFNSLSKKAFARQSLNPLRLSTSAVNPQNAPKIPNPRKLQRHPRAGND